MQDRHPTVYVEDYRVFFRSNSDALRLTQQKLNYYPFQTIRDFKKDQVDIDNGPALIWAGDMDKDGKIDLILDLSKGLYSAHITLFLSSYAEKNEYLHEVAMTLKYFDC